MFGLFKRKHNSGVYDHTVSAPFTNGAEAFGFLPKFRNPLFLVTGTGYVPQAEIQSLQRPQVYADLNAPINGLGGLQAGQIMTYPLYDPNANGGE